MTSTSSTSSHRSSLLSDKGCVVIDIGNAYTKYVSFCRHAKVNGKYRVGMSGEPAPRFIIASKTRLSSSGEVSKCSSAVLCITNSAYNQLVNVMDTKLLRTPQKLTKVMSSFMKNIYLR